MPPETAPSAPRGGNRPLLPGQIAELRVFDIETGDDRLVRAFDRLVEAPNWTPDGRWLIVNAEGLIYRIATDGAGPLERIDTGPVTDANNDHLLSPDGTTLYISARDGHLYRVALSGGTPQRITAEDPARPGLRHYLHGISPDGGTLAFVGLEPETATRPVLRNVFTIPSGGGPLTQLTTGTAAADGPEFAPDGAWIYFNSEAGATVPGHAQIVRIRPDGSGFERLTDDARVNWFPHPSPDGRHVLYLSYPEGTEGHPANLPVILRLMSPDGGDIRDLVALFGGQGTINVNSWAPDSRRFAYVAYPFAE